MQKRFANGYHPEELSHKGIRGVAIDSVEEVKEGKGAELIVGGEIRDFTPRFRESAYMPKETCRREDAAEFEAMKRAVGGAGC